MYLLYSHKITLKHAKFWVFLQVLVHIVFLLFMKYEVLYFSLVLEFYCFLSLVPFVLRHSLSGTHRRNPSSVNCVQAVHIC